MFFLASEMNFFFQNVFLSPEICQQYNVRAGQSKHGFSYTHGKSWPKCKTEKKTYWPYAMPRGSCLKDQ